LVYPTVQSYGTVHGFGQNIFSLNDK